MLVAAVPLPDRMGCRCASPSMAAAVGALLRRRAGDRAPGGSAAGGGPGERCILYAAGGLPGQGAGGGRPAGAARAVSGRRKLTRIVWQQALFAGVLRRAGVEVLFAPGYVLPLRWSGPSLLYVSRRDRLAALGAGAARQRVALSRGAAPLGAAGHPRGGAHPACGRPGGGVLPGVARQAGGGAVGVEARFQPVTDAARLAAVRNATACRSGFSLRGEPGTEEKSAATAGSVRPRAALGPAAPPGAGGARPGGRRRCRRHWRALAWRRPFTCPATLPMPTCRRSTRWPSCLFFHPWWRFGLPPLEAMACGTPALVADAPPFTETVATAALRVNPRTRRRLPPASGAG